LCVIQDLYGTKVGIKDKEIKIWHKVYRGECFSLDFIRYRE
jgi:hypothetical protein